MSATGNTASELVLGIETSCDDTAVALVDSTGRVRASLSASQDKSHAPFGGVVPEVASRRHTEDLLPLLDRLLKDNGIDWQAIQAIAVTSRPGLIGSLLVGVVTAKALALARQKPLIGINHIEGHLLAPFLSDDDYQPPENFKFPYLALAVSGGHTHLFIVQRLGVYQMLGKTRDDAAGEAMDKFAKLLGLGFPGGPKVDQMAKTGNPSAVAFPRAMLNDGSLDFSFSGLKTAAQREISSLAADQLLAKRADLCASYQEAVVDVLIQKLALAADQNRSVRAIAITGGVSANSRLRARAELWAAKAGLTLAIPPARYCTDNGAMIAMAGWLHFRRGDRSTQELSPSAHSLAGDFT